MIKRALVATLCLMMVLALLPATAFAAKASSVWICSKQLDATNPYYVNGPDGMEGTLKGAGYEGEWNAHFNASTGTLTLNDLYALNSTAEKSASVGESDLTVRYAVYANGDLALQLDGESALSVYDADNLCAVYVTGSLTLNGSGTLTADSGQATNSYGVYAGGAITVYGGGLTATCGDSATTSALNKALVLGLGVTAQGSLSNDGADAVDYVSADNARYRFVCVPNEPALALVVSPEGSVAATTPVILTATPVNMTTSPTEYSWFSNVINGTDGAVEFEVGGNEATFKPPTSTAGTTYYYCMAADCRSNIVAVTVLQPSGGGYTSPPTTVYNDSTQSDATVWLTGRGLESSDLLRTERNPSGSAYQALLNLADSDDVFAVYNILLESGQKSTGNPMHMTFDLNASYGRLGFTLVHQKSNGKNEYFYDTADSNGDVTFGPLYELSPFMLVHGRLEPLTEAAVPETGDHAQPILWLGLALMAGALRISTALLRRRRQNG